MRAVIDTNVLVSAVIFPNSVPRQAVRKALRDGLILFSDSTLNELQVVLFRPKLDRYVTGEDRAVFLSQLIGVGEMVPTVQIVRECRDPKDDKFLEVALNGVADAIVTGDADLLRMNPWRGIAILSSAEYLRG